ncbi:MAG: putative 5-nucleotidase [Blastococcus sp.]|nr:putative 5-nucleotidase [Blastococcus sp.]
MRRLSLAISLAVVTAAVVGAPAVAHAAPKKPIPVQLVAMNDFHGRISETSGGDSQIITGPGDDNIFGPNPALKNANDDTSLVVGGSAHVAATVDRVRSAFAAETGNAGSSFFVGAGDLISASTFESSFFKDEPTIEALNAMGLDVSAVGNHEFDRGTEELRRISGATDGTFTDDVSACEGVVVGETGCFGGPGHEFHGTDFPYLAANVLSGRTGKPMLPPYQVLNLPRGKKLAVIGVVTETTPTIVSPDGIADVRFIDEADAVNRVVPELERRGVNAIAVLVHEGGQVDTPNPAADYINACQNLTGPILDLNNRMDSQVDLIISAHSHQAYNCSLQDPAGEPRLVTQAGFYGRLVSDIRLTVDPRTGDVDRHAASYGATNVPVQRQGAGDAEVASIVSYWKDRAAVAGSVVVGHQTADLDRAYLASKPVRDSESSLGNLIADAQLASADSPGSSLGGADLAITNPGGIRADLNCLAPAGSGQTNGDITYAETFEVQPFSNTVNAVNLTGAAIEQILEQQWAVRGGVDSFLQLSVSSNVRYAFNPNAAAGNRVDPVSITIDNVPLNLAGTYRVAANSFLLGGGDNFTSFVTGRTGGSTPVTGPNDVDAFNAYLAVQPGPVAPPALDRAMSTDPAKQFNDDGSGRGAC